MNTEAVLHIDAPEAEQAASPAAPVRTPIDRVVAAVRHDSRVEPVKYLDEVVVPYGGE